MDWVAAIDLSNTQIVLGNLLRRHIRKIQVMNDRDTVENVTSKVRSGDGACKDGCRGGDGSEKLHVSV
jgi:hypothetical protein